MTNVGVFTTFSSSSVVLLVVVMSGPLTIRMLLRGSARLLQLPGPFFFSANFNKQKALALELGVQGQQCAQFDQDKNSVCADR